MVIGQSSLKGLVSMMKTIHCREMFAEFFIDPAVVKKSIPQNQSSYP